MVRELLAIHSLNLEAPPYEPWFDASDLLPKPWRKNTSAWAAATRIVEAGLPSDQTVFLHRDYQHFNLGRTVRRITVAGELPTGPDGFRSQALEGPLFNVLG